MIQTGEESTSKEETAENEAGETERSHVAGGSLQSNKENAFSGESGTLVNAHRKPSNPENEGGHERRTNQHV